MVRQVEHGLQHEAAGCVGHIHLAGSVLSLSFSIFLMPRFGIALVVVAVAVVVVTALVVVAVFLRCCAAVRLHLRQELATLNAISSRTLHTLASRVLSMSMCCLLLLLLIKPP